MKTTELLKAKHIAAKNLRENIFKILGGTKRFIAMKNGKPEMFLIPYEDMVELVEMLEESKDAVLRERIERSREEYRKGGGVPYQD